MGYVKQVALPEQEPVSVEQAISFLRLPSGYADDGTIAGMIQGAREEGERLSARILAQRQFLQVLDSFPYYTDTIQSQLAYPPSYYSLPRFSTTLWNYSQMIKLEGAPLISVDELTYVGPDGNTHTLVSGVDFIVDPLAEPARIFPMVGQSWPAVLYAPNAVQIKFTAGYDPDPTKTLTIGLPSPPPNPPDQQTSYQLAVGIPQKFIDGIKNLVAYKFQNRGVAATTPENIERIFTSNGMYDFAPTRG